MKTFLRITAIIFLIVLFVVVLSSLTKKEPAIIEDPLQETEISGEETLVEEGVAYSEEETLEDLVDPAGGEDEGVIILGGDGIPNN
jgi:diacylglycerol kinase family enzyme